MKSLLITISIIFVFAGCNPCKQIAKNPNKYNCFPADSIIIENTITIRDSVTYTKIDSSAYDFLFECDSNFNVILKEFNEYKAKGIKTKVVFKDNRLNLDILADSIKHLNKIIEDKSSKETTKINPINITLQNERDKLENKLKNRNKAIIGLLAFIVFLIIAYKILK